MGYSIKQQICSDEIHQLPTLSLPLRHSIKEII